MAIICTRHAFFELRTFIFIPKKEGGKQRYTHRLCVIISFKSEMDLFRVKNSLQAPRRNLALIFSLGKKNYLIVNIRGRYLNTKEYYKILNQSLFFHLSTEELTKPLIFTILIQCVRWFIHYIMTNLHRGNTQPSWWNTEMLWSTDCGIHFQLSSAVYSAVWWNGMEERNKAR